MQWFYDAQIRRYLTQMIRMLSGFKYKSADGLLHTIPVVYGDLNRQAASILQDNTLNKIISPPKIAIYIDGLELDKTRLGDQSFVTKVNIRERDIQTIEGQDYYTNSQGRNYTVERLMPTPYTIKIKADLWTTNTDQKLQILEQLMMLFNPMLEIQTSDNYVDWTSISVVILEDIKWTSRSIPASGEDNIDLATLTFSSPIWISAPSKVKRMGVITDIIMNIFDETNQDVFAQLNTTVGNFDIMVWNNEITLLDKNAVIEALEDYSDKVPITSPNVNWDSILQIIPGKFKANVSQIILKQQDGSEIVGTVSVNQNDNNILNITYDQDTFPKNSLIVSDYYPLGYGYIDAIIDPQNLPNNFSYSTGIHPPAGTRLLILSPIGDIINENGANLWKNSDNTDFIADANSIIEWNGNNWLTVLDTTETITIFITNMKTGIQYKLVDKEWVKSVDGEYKKGHWRLVT